MGHGGAGALSFPPASPLLKSPPSHPISVPKPASVGAPGTGSFPGQARLPQQGVPRLPFLFSLLGLRGVEAAPGRGPRGRRASVGHRRRGAGGGRPGGRGAGARRRGGRRQARQDRRRRGPRGRGQGWGRARSWGAGVARGPRGRRGRGRGGRGPQLLVREARVGGVESERRVESGGARRGPAVSAAVRTASAPSAEPAPAMREIVHIQAGQCGNQIGTKVGRALGFPAGGQAGRPRVSGLDPSVPALRCAPSVPLGPRSPTLPCAAPAKCSRSGAAEEGASQLGTPCPSPHPRSSWERPPAALARLEFGSRASRALPRPASPGVSCGGGRPRLRVLTVCPPASPFPSFGK